MFWSSMISIIVNEKFTIFIHIFTILYQYLVKVSFTSFLLLVGFGGWGLRTDWVSIILSQPCIAVLL